MSIFLYVLQRADLCRRAHSAFTKVSKQPLANAKPAEKGALIYRYQKLDSPTAKAHFKGVLVYKVANRRTSQNAVSHHVNKCPLAMRRRSRPRKAVNGSAKKSLLYKMQVGETQNLNAEFSTAGPSPDGYTSPSQRARRLSVVNRIQALALPVDKLDAGALSHGLTVLASPRALPTPVVFAAWPFSRMAALQFDEIGIVIALELTQASHI
jgi:hypothetical protein